MLLFLQCFNASASAVILWVSSIEQYVWSSRVSSRCMYSMGSHQISKPVWYVTRSPTPYMRYEYFLCILRSLIFPKRIFRHYFFRTAQGTVCKTDGSKRRRGGSKRSRHSRRGRQTLAAASQSDQGAQRRMPEAAQVDGNTMHHCQYPLFVHCFRFISGFGFSASLGLIPSHSIRLRSSFDLTRPRGHHGNSAN